MRKERFEIEHEGQKYVFYVRSLKFGEVRKALREATGGGKLRLLGGDVPTMEVDILALTDMMTLQAVTKEDGTPLTREEFENLPSEVGERLVAKVLELTPIFRSVGVAFGGGLEQDKP